MTNKILEGFQRADSLSVYMAQFATIYLEEKLKEKGTKKGKGKIIEELILNAPDFKEKFNNYLESAKL